MSLGYVFMAISVTIFGDNAGETVRAIPEAAYSQEDCESWRKSMDAQVVNPVDIATGRVVASVVHQCVIIRPDEWMPDLITLQETLDSPTP